MTPKKNLSESFKALYLALLLCSVPAAALAFSQHSLPAGLIAATEGTADPGDTYTGKMLACLGDGGTVIVKTDGRGNPLLGAAYLIRLNMDRASETTSGTLAEALALIGEFLPAGETIRAAGRKPLCLLAGEPLADIDFLPRRKQITAVIIHTRPAGKTSGSIEFLTGKEGASAADAVLKETDRLGGRIFQLSTSELTWKRLKNALAPSPARPQAAPTAARTVSSPARPQAAPIAAEATPPTSRPENAPTAAQTVLPPARPKSVPAVPAPAAVPDPRPAALESASAADPAVQSLEATKPSIRFIGATVIHRPDGRITVKDTGHGFRIEPIGIDPAVALDGKLVARSYLDDMDPGEIKYVRLLLAPEKAEAKYGPQAGDGVIELETAAFVRRTRLAYK